MKIVYFSGESWEKEYVGSRLPDAEVVFYEGPMQDHPDIVDNEADVLSVFVKSHVGKDEMDRFPNLKIIATRSTGFDHIDLEEAKRRGIAVCNVPAYGANTVAEFAFALLLTLSRKIYDSYKRIEQTGSFSQEGLRGFDLQGKVVGVVGTGRIGYHAIKIANGFGMRVIAYDPFPKEGLDRELGFEYVSFEDLLKRSDIITFHVPYNEHTHHLVNQGNIDQLKNGVYIINTARGPVIETEALVAGLKSGKIEGAGLDVLEEEGSMMGDETALIFAEHPNAEVLVDVLGNHYLIDHPRVIVTPHNAFNTKEALERIVDTTVENIQKFFQGEIQNSVIK